MKLITSTVLVLALLTSTAQAGNSHAKRKYVSNASSFPQPSPKHGEKFWAYHGLWFSGGGD